jgi:large subunit ribosomal protein L17
MRHKKFGRKLGRNPSHRKALFRNMAKALLIHGRITTTEAKAKSLRGVFEPLITLALKNDLHARRQAYRILGEHKLVSRLFDEIGPLFAGGGGGYTRVVKLALPRKGDSAPLAIIELVKKPGDAVAEPAKKAKAAPKKAKAEAPAEKAPAVEAEEKPVEAAAEEQGEEAPAPKKPRKKKSEEAAADE